MRPLEDVPTGAWGFRLGADWEENTMAFAVRGLEKSYGGIRVLTKVDLAVEDGEIHALLGANGAGKSTLIKCLSGAIAPDAGSMEIGGRSYASLTPRESRQAGVAVVYQELSLALSLSAADNIFLGQEQRWGPFVRHAQQRRRAAAWLAELGVETDLGGDLTNTGNAELQSIEIIRALASDPKVLILDEPTAALSEREAERLGEHLKQLRKRNLPVLYVTHRLSEVFALADRVTVLRGGRTVLSGRVCDLSQQEIVAAIAGRSVDRMRRTGEARNLKAQPPLLSARDFVAPGIGPISFDIHPGEIVGIFGLVGSGRTELVESLFGARSIHGGALHCAGKAIRPKSPADAFRSGLALVPADRLRKSVFAQLSAADNLLASSYADLCTAFMRRKPRERALFAAAAGRLNLQPNRPELEARRFSGGNQQKLVLGRWLNETKGCCVLMLDEPTQGVDVGARSEIYAALRDVVRDSGRAVIATSSEPEELIQIANRVIVLSSGRLAGELEGDAIAESRLLALAHSVEHRQEAVS
jgi:ribose transport system ATP-binding protein